MHATSTEEDIVRSEAISEISETDRNDRSIRLSWAAGFIDADGSIGVWRNNQSRTSTHPTLTVTVQASGVDERPIQMLSDLFGGNIGLFTKVVGNRRPVFYWRLSAQKALTTIEQIQPYLIAKQDQADLALAFGRMSRPKIGRPLSDEEFAVQDSYRQQIMALHKQRAKYGPDTNK